MFVRESHICHFWKDFFAHEVSLGELWTAGDHVLRHRVLWTCEGGGLHGGCRGRGDTFTWRLGSVERTCWPATRTVGSVLPLILICRVTAGSSPSQGLRSLLCGGQIAGQPGGRSVWLPL